MTRTFVGASAIVLAIGAVAVGIVWRDDGAHTVYMHPNGSVNEIEETHYWMSRIKNPGAMPAYHELARVLERSELTPTQQHSVAHYFGEALWESEGWNGFGVCDMRFGNGCAHTYFARAIVENEVLEGVTAIASLCESQYDDLVEELACTHSIGHGLVSYFGYNESALQQALDMCDTLPTIGIQATGMGCHGGALMEFNIRRLHTVPNYIRPLTEENKYTPCTNIAERHKAACIFWQPLWWFSSMTRAGEDKTEANEKINTYCQGDTLTLTLSTKCFAGHGFNIASKFGDPSTIARACAHSTADSIEGRVACWAYAAPQLQFDNNLRQETASILCENLAEQQQMDCEEKARTPIELTASWRYLSELFAAEP